ncbi:tryptophan synthase subunit alpha [Romeria aff. gracilis LEGE 07310]|uniref:Tryptophan synthase alpha chain n=1 Tax=Vasconcelosia minhoensis LEGE 07310 TaxID=915328 RepID=A0A8J7DRD5_9CYAN|nr:tryptophan synthase subunit alpha [Romeria gracilis]MBE9078274.1 tryptophan synthase subunit alpha [Romeria aff. gracilis LEGE 07310]
MTSVSDRLKALRQQQLCALIPFVMAGDPDLETTAQALQVLDTSGADLLELGVPYSDPLADGPVIHAAATRALTKGTSFDRVLVMVASVVEKLRSPLILFVYYNLILNRGVSVCLDQIQQAGIKGLVVPDLPFEESRALLRAAAERGLEVILLVAPSSPAERMRAISGASQGFVYLVSTTGVTGTRVQVDERVVSLIERLKSHTAKPIGVGFGISHCEQASQVKALGADAVIVGSAFVKRLAEPSDRRLQSIEEFCHSLKYSISVSPLR